MNNAIHPACVLTLLLLAGGGPACLRVQAQPLTDPSQAIHFEHLTSKEGLASEKVISVVQDPQGFLWIGTQEGLHRYDGYDLVLYRHDPTDASSLSDNTAEVVYVDREGALWVGTWNGLNRYDPMTDTFTAYHHDPSDPTSLSHDQIHAILEDERGRLWIGTRDGGLSRYDRERDAFVRYAHDPADATSLSYNVVSVLYVDRRGTLWVGTGLPWDNRSNRGGLNRYDPVRDAFVRYEHDPEDPATLRYNEISALYEDAEGTFWVATWNDGLHAMNRETETFTFFDDTAADSPSWRWPHRRTPNGTNGAIKFLHEDTRGVLWIGGFLGGLDRYDPTTRTLTHYAFDPDPDGLSDNTVWSIYEDRQGILWVSTWKGLNKVAPEHYAFRLVGPDAETGARLHDGHVEEILEDHEGVLWAGTWSGLERLDAETGTVTLLQVGRDLEHKEISEMVLTLYEDRDGTLWVGTLNYGLARLNRSTNSFTVYRHDPDDPESIRSNVVTAIREDRNGALWIGTDRGIDRFDRTTGRFTSVFHTPDTPPSKLHGLALAEGPGGTLWFGSAGGLDQLDPATGTVTTYLEGVAVSAICEDPAHHLWLGTIDGGLLRFDPSTRRYTAFTTTDGLPGNTVRSLIKDRTGRLWIGTTQGLAWIHPEEGLIRTFSPTQAPPIHQYYPASAAARANGDLLFGGFGGFIRFDPSTIRDDPLTPRPVLTGLRLFNEVVRPHPDGPLTASIAVAEAVTLAHHQNDLTFEYAGLHFVRPEENTYRYKLDTYEEAWREVGPQRSAIYPNLPPGEYVFRVQSANPDGIWSLDAATLRVHILPPWWQTPWAYVAYGMFFLAGVFAVDRIQRRRLLQAERERARIREAHLKAEAAEAQAVHLKSIDEAKSRFFANVSHEFRTPLTLILGPLEDLRDGITGTLDAAAQKNVDLAISNGRRLLHLVNQLLDVGRLEAGRLPLQARRIDLGAFTMRMGEAFRPLAERKAMAFHVEVPDAPCWCYVGPEQMEKVLANLLGNAFKFTEPGGTIKLVLDADAGSPTEGTVRIRICDTGPGIDAAHLPRLFERFYQVDASSTRRQSGTGIGLALVHNLIALHHGQVTVESEVGVGSTFTVTLPLGPRHLTDEERAFPEGDPGVEMPWPDVEEESQLAGEVYLDPNDPAAGSDGASDPAVPADDDRTTVLVVDDNAGVRTYVRRHLEPRYRVVEAVNGRAALDVARQLVPDLVVADVMMPELDGYGLCRALKHDPELDFIPVILLTARASEGSKLSGLEEGADAYVTKPFNVRELALRVDNLIATRRRLKEHLAAMQPGLAASPVLPVDAPSIEDEVLLVQARQAIDARLSDEAFGVEDLAQALDLSRTTLYRRINAAAALSPMDLIWTVRLERAAALLADGLGTVSEVAYAVGFKSVSHFGRRFRAAYEVSPSGYARGERA